jgi:hypothetical protein
MTGSAHFPLISAVPDLAYTRDIASLLLITRC